MITSRQHMEAARRAFAAGRIDVATLEAELEFWLAVEDCPLCDGQMCSAHYTRICAESGVSV